MIILASKKNYIGFGLLLFFAAASFLTYLQVSQLKIPQSTVSKASAQTALINWGHFPKQIDTDESLVVPIYLNSKQYGFSAIQIIGSVSNISPGDFELIPSQPSGLDLVIAKLEPDGSDTKFTLVYFSSISNSSLFSAHQDVRIAQLSFSDLDTGEHILSLNADKSKLASYLYPNLVLSTAADKSFVVVNPGEKSDSDSNAGENRDCNQNCTQDANCRSELICYKGLCRGEADIKDTACRAELDKGMHRACNEYCADSHECDRSLECYYNRCRDPKNLELDNCYLAFSETKTQSTSAKGSAAVVLVPTPKPTPAIKVTVVIDADKYGIDEDTNVGARVASPSSTPRPTLRPSPIATILPSPSIRPTAQPEPQVFEEEKGANIWLRIFIAIAVIGVVGAAGYLALMNWNPKADSF